MLNLADHTRLPLDTDMNRNVLKFKKISHNTNKNVLKFLNFFKNYTYLFCMHVGMCGWVAHVGSVQMSWSTAVVRRQGAWGDFLLPPHGILGIKLRPLGVELSVGVFLC